MNPLKIAQGLSEADRHDLARGGSSSLHKQGLSVKDNTNIGSAVWMARHLAGAHKWKRTPLGDQVFRLI